jgi:hypothetical protein
MPCYHGKHCTCHCCKPPAPKGGVVTIEELKKLQGK